MLKYKASERGSVKIPFFNSAQRLASKKSRNMPLSAVFPSFCDIASAAWPSFDQNTAGIGGAVLVYSRGPFSVYP